jgi:hypothetical protein
MKLLKAIIILCSIIICNQCIAGSVSKKPLEINKSLINDLPTPIFLGEDIKYSMPHYLWRSSQYMRFRLKKEEKQQHESAVFFMLDNAANGEVVSWYSDSRLATGKVRVIHSYPISGGYCRQYQAFIQVKNKSKHFTNNACRYDTRVWFFYK